MSSLHKLVSTLKLWPQWKQWQRWSLPSRLTFIGTLVTVISLMIAISLPLIEKLFPSENNSITNNIVYSDKDSEVEKLKLLTNISKIQDFDIISLEIKDSEKLTEHERRIVNYKAWSDKFLKLQINKGNYSKEDIENYEKYISEMMNPLYGNFKNKKDLYYKIKYRGNDFIPIAGLIFGLYTSDGVRIGQFSHGRMGVQPKSEISEIVTIDLDRENISENFQHVRLEQVISLPHAVKR